MTKESKRRELACASAIFVVVLMGFACMPGKQQRQQHNKPAPLDLDSSAKASRTIDGNRAPTSLQSASPTQPLKIDPNFCKTASELLSHRYSVVSDSAASLSKQQEKLCRSARKRHQRTIESYRGPRLPGAELELANAFQCLPSQDGVWTIVLKALYNAQDIWQPEALRGRLALEFVSENGKRMTAIPVLPSYQPLRPECSSETPSGAENFGIGFFHQSRVELLRIFDWNGDGIEEAAVYTSVWEHEGSSLETIRIWTIEDDELIPYPNQPDIFVKAIDDVDQDGRPDIITFEPYLNWAPGALNDYLIHGPPLLHHSLQDGTFTADDATAKRFIECSCPGFANPKVLAVKLRGFNQWDLDEQLPLLVACAHIAGLGVDEILTVITEKCKALGEVHDNSLCRKPSIIRRFITGKNEIDEDSGLAESFPG